MIRRPEKSPGPTSLTPVTPSGVEGPTAQEILREAKARINEIRPTRSDGDAFEPPPREASAPLPQREPLAVPPARLLEQGLPPLDSFIPAVPVKAEPLPPRRVDSSPEGPAASQATKDALWLRDFVNKALARLGPQPERVQKVKPPKRHQRGGKRKRARAKGASRSPRAESRGPQARPATRPPLLGPPPALHRPVLRPPSPPGRAPESETSAGDETPPEREALAKDVRVARGRFVKG